MSSSKTAKIFELALQKMHHPCAKLAQHNLTPNQLTFILGIKWLQEGADKALSLVHPRGGWFPPVNLMLNFVHNDGSAQNQFF